MQSRILLCKNCAANFEQNIFIGLNNSNANPKIVKRFIDLAGYLKLGEVKKLLTELNENSKSKTPSSNLLATLSREQPDIYPNHILLMSWFKAGSWSEVLKCCGYELEVKDLSAKKEYYRQCLGLAKIILEKEGKSNLSKIDYDSLTLKDLEYLKETGKITDEEIFSIIDKNSYAKLNEQGRFPSSNKVSIMFSSWNEAKKQIGATIHDANKRTHLSSAEVLDKLVAFTIVLKRLPSLADLCDIKNNDICSKSYYVYSHSFKNHTWADILFLVVKRLNAMQLGEYVNLSGLPSPTKLKLSKLINEVGLVDVYKNELIDHLIVFIKKLKRLPRSSELLPNKGIKYSINVYFKAFENNSWAEILFEAIKRIQGTTDEKYIDFDKLAEKTRMKLLGLLAEHDKNNEYQKLGA